ncbi:GNAT family N-acetyltransferase [Candidatus Saccharibacteria bacterium]|nr:GNAT family N-acetyltransferase [Candidatus Saccharibacteria bacterium]
MTIRGMTSTDVAAVVALGQNVGELAVSDQSLWWGESRLQSWVDAGQDILLVADADGQVVGVQLTWVHAPTRMLYLSDIVVDPKWRGQGIAKALLEETLSRAHLLGLDWAYGLTQPTNERIQQLLQAHGFTKGEDLVWYEKKPL